MPLANSSNPAVKFRCEQFVQDAVRDLVSWYSVDAYANAIDDGMDFSHQEEEKKKTRKN